MTRMLALALALPLLLVTPPARAQVQAHAGENVTWAYAQVLRASPVYRMVQVPTSETRCNAPLAAPPTDRAAARDGGCHVVPVVYQERRLVGYDVEYLYKGETYMSRLAADPGSRLRIRISVAPDDPAVDHR